MKQTKKLSRKVISYVLALVMVLSTMTGIVPGMSLTAQAAWDGDPYADLLNTTTAVKFDNKDWYLVENDSTALNAGTVTLLSKECVGASVFGSNNTYSGSTVETYVNNWYTDNIDAKAAVDGRSMFLLTREQALTIEEANANVLKCAWVTGADAIVWWLCSPRPYDRVACVMGNEGMVGANEPSKTYGVRPALKLDLSKVTFDSDAKTFELKPPKTAQIVTAPSPATSLSYTGEELALLTGGATVATGNTEAIVQYSLTPTDDNSWVDSYTAVKATNAGEYKVYYRVAGNDTYADFVSSDEQAVSVTIAKDDSVTKVIEAINKLPASDKVATTDKAAIKAARKAYDNLTADQKKKVPADVLKKLTDAENALKAAEKDAADKAAADKVIEAINKLPASDKVATTDKAAIKAARKAYDALTADQKKKVPADVLKKLTDAEKALKAAKELEAAKKEAQAAMNEQVTVTQKGNKFTVKWKKAKSADGYYVYAQYCGKKFKKPVKTIKKNTTTKVTIKKINGKKLNLKKQFRVYVVPYKIIDGKKVKLGKSMVGHVVGSKNTKYSNVKKLTLKKKKYTVKVGKTAKIKAKVTLVNKNKKHIPKGHGAKFRYKSSDTSIATVSKNGKIKGIKKGKCTIYVYSINGLTKKAKITVK